jgi:hypothetical protein
MFGITTSYSTALPALDAREDLGRARRSRLTAQVGQCITGRLSRERGPVAAAVRHAGRAAVEAALRSFFAPRSRADGTVRTGVVLRCYLAERAR